MADPGNNWKKIVIYISDSAHAEMRLKLRYDQLSQNLFFKKVIAAYLEDDRYMREFILNANKEKISKRDQKKMDKDDKVSNQQIDSFGLNEEEINDIYDLIEGQED
jgi:predicted nucleic acid-binding protein